MAKICFGDVMGLICSGFYHDAFFCEVDLRWGPLIIVDNTFKSKVADHLKILHKSSEVHRPELENHCSRTLHGARICRYGARLSTNCPLSHHFSCITYLTKLTNGRLLEQRQLFIKAKQRNRIEAIELKLFMIELIRPEASF